MSPPSGYANRASAVVLFAATLATLSSGTNYVVGSYAPQLKDKLHLTAAQINLVASCGNFGVYLTGPFFGHLADRNGPRVLVFVGAVLLGIGYLGLFWSYEKGGHDMDVSAGTEDSTNAVATGSSVSLPLLALFSFSTGLGSALGMTSGLNAVARAFLPATRGLAMGIVVAGYGLSAFCYANISGLIIGDNTGLFLLVLAVGTFASLFIAGTLLTRDRMESAYERLPTVAPPDTVDATEMSPDRDALRRATSRSAFARVGSLDDPDGGVASGRVLFDSQEDDIPAIRISGIEDARGRSDSNTSVPGVSASVSPSGLVAPSRTSAHQKQSSIALKTAMDTRLKEKHDNGTVETTSIGLFRVPDYYLLMLVAFACTGTGIMWINSVGTVVVTLVEYNNVGGKITRHQSHQTSLLSLFNCLGRLFVGAVSDQTRTRVGIKPVWWMAFMCLTFIISQMLARSADDLSSLSWATSLVGFSYGQFFGLAPIVMLDWFGLKAFSANVGTLYVIPTFSSYTFSHLFGSIYDAKTPSTPSPPEQDNVSSPALLSRALRQLLGRAGDVTGHVHICPLGRECYSQIFAYTIPACILAFILSIVLSLRRGRGLENSGKDRHQALDEEEFLAEVEH